MFPDSPMFSKILENIKGDFSKSSQTNKHHNPEIIQERPKSSLNRKNVYSTKYSLPEMRQINSNYAAKNKFKVMKNSDSFNQMAYDSNMEAYENNNKEAHLFSFNNRPNLSNKSNFENKLLNKNNFGKSCQNNYANSFQKEYNSVINRKDKFDINNFMLNNEDFHYSNKLENKEFNEKNKTKGNIKLQKIDNINNSDYKIETDKIDYEKLVHDYRLQLNKELLRRLFEEREKETIRDKLLNNARDNNERKKMEQRFIYERAQASAEIIQINE